MEVEVRRPRGKVWSHLFAISVSQCFSSMFPVCFQCVSSVFPACYQSVFGPLSVRSQSVPSPFSVRFQSVNRLLKSNHELFSGYIAVLSYLRSFSVNKPSHYDFYSATLRYFTATLGIATLTNTLSSLSLIYTQQGSARSFQCFLAGGFGSDVLADIHRERLKIVLR